MFAGILHAKFTYAQKSRFTFLTFLIAIVGLLVAALPQLPPQPLTRQKICGNPKCGWRNSADATSCINCGGSL